MKPSGIGGQAVIEGVMMKNGSKYAVAVRKPNHEIVVETNKLTESAKKYPLLQLPIIRGVAAFVESMSLGMKTLTFSASFYEEEEEESGLEKKLNKVTKGNAEKILNAFTILLSVVLAIGIFVALPMLLAGFLSAKIESETVLALLEGIFRVLIFIGYIFLISRIQDIKRLFMYHGAEHKSINCIENGLPLTVANVRKQSREHKRCGTSFMLTVMVISVIFFIFIRVDNALLRFVIRLLLIPVIAGVSYEFIRLAGRSNSKVVAVLSRPGMWLQALTTKEPDDDMIEVAIQSVEAVFDWQSFIEKDGKRSSGKKGKHAKHTKDEKSGKETPVQPKEDKAAATAGGAEVSATKESDVAVAAPISVNEVTEAKEQLAAAAEKPLEVDLSQLFDIKVPEEMPEVKHGSKPKKDPMPQATEAVSKAASEEEDDILKALDMYFEFDGPKSVMEISDEEK
ncbi:MAG: DUF1385 domain-containing protein [Lachnospiraceae bacterium]